MEAIKVKVGSVTVKIYTRQRNGAHGQLTFFQVADYTNGRRRLQGFNDLTEAKKEAERIAKQLSTGRADAAQMNNADAASYGRAVQLLKPVGIPLEVAASNYAQMFEMLGGDHALEAARFYARHRADKITRKTVADVIAELIESKESRDKSERYTSDLSARLSRFAKAFQSDIGSVTGPDVQRWLDGIKRAPQTVKNYRTVLHTLFEFAASRGYILRGSNPVAETETVKVNHDDLVEIYTPEEVKKLIDASPVEFRPVILLGAFAGLRTSEIERLDWSDIDLERGSMRVRGKIRSAGRRLVPVLPNLAAWLKPLVDTGNVWKGTPQTLRDRRADTCKAAKVAWKENALRHSFISYRLADIQNAAQVAMEAGNSPQVIFKHYREIVRSEAAKVWFSIAPGQ